MARMTKGVQFGWAREEEKDFGGWSAGTRPGSGRNWASTAWLLAGTIAVAVTSYSLSLKVASERREMEKIEGRNGRLETQLKAMDAELRVRMRMPQLQRWNDSVLGLMPISASQYVNNPVQLTAYGTPLESDMPRVQLAVRDAAPAIQKPVGPILASATMTARAAPAIERPAPAPVDLLTQVDMIIGPSSAGQP